MSEFSLYFNSFSNRTQNASTDLTDNFEWILLEMSEEDDVTFQVAQGILKFVHPHFCIYSPDMVNITYEIKYTLLEDSEITIKSKADNSSMDLKEFIAIHRDLGTGNAPIFEYTKEGSNPPLNVKFYLDGDILKIIRSTESVQHQEATYLNSRYYPSRLQEIIINDVLLLRVRSYGLLHTLLELTRLRIPFTVHKVQIPMMGHSITIPCLEITAKEFKLVYCSEQLLEAHISKNIVDSSYFTTTTGDKYNMKELLEKEGIDKHFHYVEGYNADDAWHILNYNEKYVYSLGYCV